MFVQSLFHYWHVELTPSYKKDYDFISVGIYSQIHLKYLMTASPTVKYSRSLKNNTDVTKTSTLIVVRGRDCCVQQLQDL